MSPSLCVWLNLKPTSSKLYFQGTMASASCCSWGEVKEKETGGKFLPMWEIAVQDVNEGRNVRTSAAYTAGWKKRFLSRNLRGTGPRPPPLCFLSPNHCSLTCWGFSGKVLVVGVCKDLGQLLVGHVSQLSEVQEIEVDLQRGDTAQRLWGLQETQLPLSPA